MILNEFTTARNVTMADRRIAAINNSIILLVHKIVESIGCFIFDCCSFKYRFEIIRCKKQKQILNNLSPTHLIGLFFFFNKSKTN